MSGIDVGAVPARSGAVAVIDLASDPGSEEQPGPDAAPDDSLGVNADGELVGDWDIADLLGPDTSVPPVADAVARQLSRLAKDGVILLTATLGGEDEIAGQLAAVRYVEGAPAEELAVGLVLANADEVVEDLALGMKEPAEVKGYLRSGEVPRWRAARLIAKSVRRRRRS